MSISLVSAPVIGFDLVRHPRGAAIAEILLLGLSLEPDDLRAFALAAEDAPITDHEDVIAAGVSLAHTDATGRWVADEMAPERAKTRDLPGIRRTRLRSVDDGDEGTGADGTGLDGVGDAAAPVRRVDDGLHDQILRNVETAGLDEPLAELNEAIEALLRTMIIDVNVLENLIRRDILGWCTPGAPYPYGETASRRTGEVAPEHARAAADVLVDAITAEWDETLEPARAAELGRPLRAIRATLANRAPDVGPCALPVMRVLHDLRHLGPDGCSRLRATNAVLGSGVSAWAAAVHETSWAVMTTGRVHAAACAQFLAVLAFAESGLDAADGAQGIWNIVSGHLHACVVGDVLAQTTREILAKTWITALPD